MKQIIERLAFGAAMAILGAVCIISWLWQESLR
jgi:hypothetical protein